MSDPAIGKVKRRRRSWYRRRLRIRRILACSALVVVIAFVCWENAARILHLPSIRTAQVLPDSFRTRANLRTELAWTPPHAKRVKYADRVPGMYPYSVVPGGIRNAESLRQASARDRAVARHFSHFDFDNAHLVRVTEPREVYVSYRIRDTIFWSRKRIRLHKGELLLTDGKIAARAKCGNQISETAKPEVSDEEPEEAVMEEPVALEPIGPSLPIHPVLPPPDLPAGQPSAPKLFANGFSFPYVPSGVPLPPDVCRFIDGVLDKHCHPHRHKHPLAPEPAPFLLLATGLFAVFYRDRTTTLTS